MRIGCHARAGFMAAHASSRIANAANTTVAAFMWRGDRVPECRGSASPIGMSRLLKKIPRRKHAQRIAAGKSATQKPATADAACIRLNHPAAANAAGMTYGTATAGR